MEWSEIGYIALGIVATLIGSIILKILEVKLNRIGKKEIYGKVVEFDNQYFELKLEIKNPTNDVWFIRQLKLCGIKNDTLYPLVQCNYSENDTTQLKEYYADEGFYSFTIPNKELSHFVVAFAYDKKNMLDSFDRFVCQYFDDKNKIITLNFDYKSKDWQLFQPIGRRKS